MGFGSGGGFTPSPNNVPGSTKTGTDKDTDVHEFTGSVDITGSLTLNGSAITGGGGGGTPGGADTQVQFNDAGSFGGSANFTFDGSTVTTPDAKVNGDLVVENTSGAVLTVSGSGGDGTDTYLAVLGSGDVGIRLFADSNNSDETDNPYIDFYQDGEGVSPRTRARRLATMGLESNNGTSFTDSYANGFYIDAFYPSLVNSARTFQIATDSTNNGHRARISIEGTNGFVGIETNSPTALLHVSSSTSEDLFRVDHNDYTDNPIFVITGSGQVGIGIGTPTAGTVLDVDPDNAAGSNSVRFKGSAQATLFHYSAGEHIYLRGGKTTSTVFIADARTSDGSSNQKTIIGNAASTSAKLHVSSSDNPTVMTVTSNSGSILTALENQRVGIGTDTPIQTLSVSGSAAFSGAFGSTAIETLTANGTISANTGLTLIDASSSLAVNNTLLFSIADGTFSGQEKKIRGLIISGSDGANSTGIYIFGTNIDSPPSLGGSGQIVLSSSNPAAGPSFQRAGCSLVWDGSKWLPVGNYNFNINSTGF